MSEANRVRQALRQAAVAVFLLVAVPQAVSGQRPGRAALDSLVAGLVTHDELIARAMVEDARTGDCDSEILIQRHEILPSQAIPSRGIRAGDVDYTVGWSDDKGTLLQGVVPFARWLSESPVYQPIAPMIAQLLLSLEGEVLEGKREAEHDGYGMHTFKWADLLRGSGNCR